MHDGAVNSLPVVDAEQRSSASSARADIVRFIARTT